MQKAKSRALFTIFFLCAAWAPAPAFALDTIIHPYTSVRSTGMGGVRLTTGLYEENFFGNPARAAQNPKWKLTLLDPTVEVSDHISAAAHSFSGGGDFYRAVGDNAGDNTHGRVEFTTPSVYIPTKNWGFAFGVITSALVDADPRRNFEIDPVSFIDIGPALTVSRKFLSDRSLSVGTTVHAMYRLSSNANFGFLDLIHGTSISPRSSGGQGGDIDFDLGTNYEFHHWRPAGVLFSTGFAVNNVLGGKYNNFKLQPIKDSSGQPTPSALPTPQPRSLGFGIAATKDKVGIMHHVSLAFEVQDIGNNQNGSLYRTLHFGGETHLAVCAFRAGVNQGYFTAGFGLDLKVLTIDLSTYGEELSLNPGGLQDRRYAARVALQI